MDASIGRADGQPDRVHAARSANRLKTTRGTMRQLRWWKWNSVAGFTPLALAVVSLPGDNYCATRDMRGTHVAALPSQDTLASVASTIGVSRLLVVRASKPNDV